MKSNQSENKQGNDSIKKDRKIIPIAFSIILIFILFLIYAANLNSNSITGHRENDR